MVLRPRGWACGPRSWLEAGAPAFSGGAPCCPSPSVTVHGEARVQGRGWRDVTGPAPCPWRPHHCPEDCTAVHQPHLGLLTASALGEELRAHSCDRGGGDRLPHGHVHSRGRRASCPTWRDPGFFLPAISALLAQHVRSRDRTRVPHNALGPRGRSLWGSLSVELPFCFVLT